MCVCVCVRQEMSVTHSHEVQRLEESFKKRQQEAEQERIQVLAAHTELNKTTTKDLVPYKHQAKLPMI